MERFRIGFTTVTFRKKTPEEIVTLAVKNGIRYLEWGTDVHVPTTDAAKEVRRLCDEHGIETVSLGAYHRIGVPNETPFSETAEIARILGARRIRVWLGKKSSHLFTVEERTALLQETRALIDLASPYGIEIAFEFHRKTMNDTGESSLAFLRNMNAKGLSTYWQPFFHETPESDFPFRTDMENLLAVRPYISAAHVFSWDEAANRFPLAKHEDAWQAFIETLRESPCRDLIMEFVKDDSEAQFEEDLALLRELVKSE